jgi:alkylation response protein AidB-like acyl-CoA dehydrogenase
MVDPDRRRHSESRVICQSTDQGLRVERQVRKVRVMQIFEGTNQIQRLVISRDLARG